jgi:hypothetical protein
MGGRELSDSAIVGPHIPKIAERFVPLHFRPQLAMRFDCHVAGGIPGSHTPLRATLSTTRCWFLWWNIIPLYIIIVILPDIP